MTQLHTWENFSRDIFHQFFERRDLCTHSHRFCSICRVYQSKGQTDVYIHTYIFQWTRCQHHLARERLQKVAINMCALTYTPNFIRRKSSPKMWATYFLRFKKTPKVNYQSMVENLPNLVTPAQESVSLRRLTAAWSIFKVKSLLEKFR
jgi:hypothetical protein